MTDGVTLLLYTFGWILVILIWLQFLSGSPNVILLVSISGSLGLDILARHYIINASSELAFYILIWEKEISRVTKKTLLQVFWIICETVCDYMYPKKNPNIYKMRNMKNYIKYILLNIYLIKYIYICFIIGKLVLASVLGTHEIGKWCNQGLIAVKIHFCVNNLNSMI